MESSKYWQYFSKIIDMESKDEDSLQLIHINSHQVRDEGKILYEGRMLSTDMFLTVPTFIRRGIAIIV